jgi:beta-xylosidase
MADTRTNQKNLQYHFVVRWDEASRSWSVDADTLDAKFDAEVAWDEDSNTWLSYREDDALRATFTDREDALALMLQEYNDLLHYDDDDDLTI